MSSSGVFGPPPPGIDLSETQNAAVIDAVISLTVIGTAAVVLRIIARAKTKGTTFALDDYLVIAGLVRLDASWAERSAAHRVRCLRSALRVALLSVC